MALWYQLNTVYIKKAPQWMWQNLWTIQRLKTHDIQRHVISVCACDIGIVMWLGHGHFVTMLGYCFILLLYFVIKHKLSNLINLVNNRLLFFLLRAREREREIERGDTEKRQYSNNYHVNYYVWYRTLITYDDAEIESYRDYAEKESYRDDVEKESYR